jgi:hypothetical protein
MSGLIFTNATLTRIAAPGTSDDYDVAGTPGTARWTGSVGVTIRRDPIVEVQGAQALNVIRTTRMEVPYDIGSVIEHNDAVTYTYEGETWTRRVDDITRAREVGRVRVELEDA